MPDFTGIGSVAEFAGKVLDRVLPDQAAKDAANLELFKLQQAGEFKQLDATLALAQGQIDTNKIEAANPRLFVSGWRPWCGWIGGFSLLYAAVIEPFMRWLAVVVWHYTGTFPAIDTTITMQVLLGLLGLTASRTVEKRAGVASK